MNRCTVRVFNFIACDKKLMDIAKKHDSYKSFTDELIDLHITSTNDNVSLSDTNLDYSFLNDFVGCLK